MQDWTALQFAAPSARGKHDIALAAMGRALCGPLKPSTEEKMSSNLIRLTYQLTVYLACPIVSDFI